MAPALGDLGKLLLAAALGGLMDVYENRMANPAITFVIVRMKAPI